MIIFCLFLFPGVVWTMDHNKSSIKRCAALLKDAAILSSFLFSPLRLPASSSSSSSPSFYRVECVRLATKKWPSNSSSRVRNMFVAEKRESRTTGVSLTLYLPTLSFFFSCRLVLSLPLSLSLSTGLLFCFFYCSDG
jgi:hypothetical protein